MCCRFIHAPPQCLLSSLRGSISLPLQSITTNTEDFIPLELMCGASAATWRRSVLRRKRPLNITMQRACLDKTGTEVLSYAPGPNPRLLTPQLRTLTSTPLRRTCVKSVGLHMNTHQQTQNLSEDFLCDF